MNIKDTYPEFLRQKTIKALKAEANYIIKNELAHLKTLSSPAAKISPKSRYNWRCEIIKDILREIND